MEMDVWALVSWLLLLALAVAGLAFLLFCSYVKYIHMKYDHIPGPPRDSFLLGHTPSMNKIIRNNGIIYELFLQWAEKYGPITRINIIHKVHLIVTSPEATKAFLMSPKYTKSRDYEEIFYLFGERCLGGGLVTNRDYEQWHKQRRVMDPAFSRMYLIGLMGTFNEKAEMLMEKLAEKADGKTEVPILDLMGRVTLDVIGQVAFGMQINALLDDRTPFPRAVSMVLKGMHMHHTPFIKWHPGKQKLVKDVQESVRLLRRTARECIAQRQKAFDNGEEMPMDILTQILKGGSLEGHCDEEIMLDNFITFFIAGHETTANQMSFAVMSLASEPKHLEKVQAEVDEVIGSKRDLDYEDISKLQYLGQVLKETLRLYPTAPATSRLLEEEMVIDGVKVPANSCLVFNMYVVGRMSKFYPDPLVFNPDRFSPDAPKPYYTYYPFSLGPRSCIGQIFAQMEAKVVLAKLLQRYEFKLVPGQSFRILDNGSLRPFDGVICRITPRRKAKG